MGYSLEHFFVGFHYSSLWRNKTFNVLCEDIYSFHQSQLTIKRLKTQMHISRHIFFVTILLPISLWINIPFRIQFNIWVLFILKSSYWYQSQNFWIFFWIIYNIALWIFTIRHQHFTAMLFMNFFSSKSDIQRNFTLFGKDKKWHQLNFPL